MTLTTPSMIDHMFQHSAVRVPRDICVFTGCVTYATSSSLDHSQQHKGQAMANKLSVVFPVALILVGTVLCHQHSKEHVFVPRSNLGFYNATDTALNQDKPKLEYKRCNSADTVTLSHSERSTNIVNPAAFGQKICLIILKEVIILLLSDKMALTISTEE